MTYRSPALALMFSITALFCAAGAEPFGAEPFGAEPFGAEPETIRVGVQLPITGERASVGRLVVNGLQMALDAVNDRKGEQEPRLEITLADDESTPEGAVKAIGELARDRAGIRSRKTAFTSNAGAAGAVYGNGTSRAVVGNGTGYIARNGESARPSLAVLRVADDAPATGKALRHPALNAPQRADSFQILTSGQPAPGFRPAFRGTFQDRDSETPLVPTSLGV